MSVFTKVTEAELLSWLRSYSLGSLLQLQGIASGIENTNYFVTTTNGRFVLTLFEKLTADELPFYLNLMAHLARHGIPCPAPVANSKEQFFGELNGKPASIVTRLPGKSLTHPSVDNCSAIGAMLGQMHLAGQSFGINHPNPRGAAWRQAAGRQVCGFLSAADAILLVEELEFHRQNSLESLPQGVIHADLFRDNVLFDGGRVGGLIDFYFACHDALLYDVAITVNDWCVHENGALDVARATALLSSYRNVRSFTREEAEMWPVALRLAGLRFWISRLFDLHLPRPGELIHAHDPEQFRRILAMHRANSVNPVVTLP